MYGNYSFKHKTKIQTNGKPVLEDFECFFLLSRIVDFLNILSVLIFLSMNKSTIFSIKKIKQLKINLK